MLHFANNLSLYIKFIPYLIDLVAYFKYSSKNETFC